MHKTDAPSAPAEVPSPQKLGLRDGGDQPTLELAQTIVEYSALILAAIGVLFAFFSVLIFVFGLRGLTSVRELEKEVRTLETQTRSKYEDVARELADRHKALARTTESDRQTAMETFRSDLKSQLVIIERQVQRTLRFEAGRYAYESGNLTQARRIFFELLEQEPASSDGQLRYYLANCFRLEGLLEEAIAEFTLSVSFRDAGADTYFGLGMCHAALGFKVKNANITHHRKAEEAFKRACELNPKFDRARIRLGHLYRDSQLLEEEKERLEMALEQYQQAQAIRKSANAAFNIGLIKFVQNGLPAALKHFDDVASLSREQIRQASKTHWAHYYRGVVALLRGNWNEASKEFAASLSLHGIQDVRNAMIDDLRFLKKAGDSSTRGNLQKAMQFIQGFGK